MYKCDILEIYEDRLIDEVLKKIVWIMTLKKIFVL